jgi:4-hydroxy-tetrahydrodipicolinate synthase
MQSFMESFPNGVYTVLVTPFTKSNNIDFDSIANWLDIQYDVKKSGNIVGLVLLGTTSEAPTLKTSEKISICEFVHNYNCGKENPKKIIIGVGGNFTEEVIEFTYKIKDYADGIMVTVPYYNKPPQRGIEAHFKTIAKSFPELPIMMYNVPGRTGINMEAETIIKIIESCKNIVAVKEANGDINSTKKLVELLTNSSRNLGETFKIFSGDDINVLTHCMMGASGVISVASNIIPKHITDIVDNCMFGKYDEASKNLENISDFVKYLFVEANPIPIKEIMHKSGMYETNIMRLPLVQMDSEKSKVLSRMFIELE